MDAAERVEPLTNSVRVLSDPVEETFLFVNETNSSPAFKQGRRQDIRSHVRRHVAKQFRQSHKEIGEEERKARYYHTLAPSGSLGGPAKSSYRGGGTSGSVRTPNIEEAQSIRVANRSDENKVLTELDSTELPNGADIYSIALRREISFASGPSVASFDLGFQTPDQSWDPEDESTGGLKGRSKKAESQTSLVTRKPLRLVTLNSSPFEVLGAGRVDPFLSYPVKKPDKYLHEFMDHAITYVLPGLIPNEPRDAVNPVSKAWFTSGLKNPLLFHALVFAGSIHLDFMRWSKIYPNSPRALVHKLEVIKHLKEVMGDPKQASKDEVILAILILSSHETMGERQGRSNPFVSPLRSAQWLDVYGNIRYVPEHVKAVGDLVALRGGIEKLKLYGLAETIITGDTVSSTNSLSKPGIPQLRVSEKWIASVIAWAASCPRGSNRTPRQGFLRLQNYGVTTNAISVFDAMRATTFAIDNYLGGGAPGPGLTEITRTRTSVQGRLLALPLGAEIEEDSQLKPNVYEVSRLTAIIFGIAVIFPIPNSFNVLQTLVEHLKLAIEVSAIDTFGTTLSDIYLWILVLGGIAALDKPERTWFVIRLAELEKELNIYAWESVEEIMESFLWLESACGPGGRRLWAEALERHYSLEISE